MAFAAAQATEDRIMVAKSFHASRRYADGPAAVFVHGFPLNGFQWRDVIESLGGVRR